MDVGNATWNLRDHLHCEHYIRGTAAALDWTSNSDLAELRSGVICHAIRRCTTDADECRVRWQHVIEFNVACRSAAAVRSSDRIRQSFVWFGHACLRAALRRQDLRRCNHWCGDWRDDAMVRCRSTWRRWRHRQCIVSHEVMDVRDAAWNLRDHLHCEGHLGRTTAAEDWTGDSDFAELRSRVARHAIRRRTRDTHVRRVGGQHVVELYVRSRSTTTVRGRDRVRQSFIRLSDARLRSSLRCQNFLGCNHRRGHRRNDAMIRRRWAWCRWRRGQRIVSDKVVDVRYAIRNLSNDFHRKGYVCCTTTAEDWTGDSDFAKFRSSITDHTIRRCTADADECRVRRQHVVELNVRCRCTAAVGCGNGVRQCFIWFCDARLRTANVCRQNLLRRDDRSCDWRNDALRVRRWTWRRWRRRQCIAGHQVVDVRDAARNLRDDLHRESYIRGSTTALDWTGDSDLAELRSGVVCHAIRRCATDAHECRVRWQYIIELNVACRSTAAVRCRDRIGQRFIRLCKTSLRATLCRQNLRRRNHWSRQRSDHAMIRCRSTRCGWRHRQRIVGDQVMDVRDAAWNLRNHLHCESYIRGSTTALDWTSDGDLAQFRSGITRHAIR